MKNALGCVVFVGKWVGVGCFLKIGLRVRCYCQKMDRSVSFLLKNELQGVAFLEKLVGVDCFSRKMGGRGGCFLSKNGWE